MAMTPSGMFSCPSRCRSSTRRPWCSWKPLKASWACASHGSSMAWSGRAKGPYVWHSTFLSLKALHHSLSSWAASSLKGTRDQVVLEPFSGVLFSSSLASFWDSFFASKSFTASAASCSHGVSVASASHLSKSAFLTWTALHHSLTSSAAASLEETRDQVGLEPLSGVLFLTILASLSDSFFASSSCCFLCRFCFLSSASSAARFKLFSLSAIFCVASLMSLVSVFRRSCHFPGTWAPKIASIFACASSRILCASPTVVSFNSWRKSIVGLTCASLRSLWVFSSCSKARAVARRRCSRGVGSVLSTKSWMAAIALRSPFSCTLDLRM
mmetsp:Transcript_64067/g.150157  ORF Transcript_64067/g.150157 Transcript_64067/m.150157 type:complete len:327 (-) Transcript_64067:169-1149(-)